jgi:DNA polymerase IV
MGLLGAPRIQVVPLLRPRCMRLFKAAVADIAPQIEDRGIDEIYIDLTDVSGDTVELAQRIKDNVGRATGLSCSIGVTSNKLLSKVASELQKPDACTRTWPHASKRRAGLLRDSVRHH